MTQRILSRVLGQNEIEQVAGGGVPKTLCVESTIVNGRTKVDRVDDGGIPE